MVGLLYSDVVMGARMAGRNPSVTWLCFKSADKAAEAQGLICLHLEEYQPKFEPPRPLNNSQIDLHRGFMIGQGDLQRQIGPFRYTCIVAFHSPPAIRDVDHSPFTKVVISRKGDGASYAKARKT